MVENLVAVAVNEKDIYHERDFVLRGRVKFSLSETMWEQELRVFERRAEEIRKRQEAPTTARNLPPNSTNEHARAPAQQQMEKEERQEATARMVRDARAREEMAEREDGERQRADHEREEIRREESGSKWQESAEQALLC